MFRFLRTFALFFVAFLSFDGGAFAGSFTCNSAKTYVSCNAGYYLSDCGSYRDGRAIASPAAGNSCRACPAATSSAYYECTGGAVCPKNMVENEFTIKTTSLAANTVFSFKISAAGVFYVKWGDSSVVQKIDRTNDTAETSYSHTYTTSGVKTITISGQATAYTTSVSIPAINFYNNKNIASISGSLGAVFGTLSNGTQPRFFQSFYGATNLAGTIPSTLFNGITGTPVSHMFAGTFQNCSKLTSIGTGLFSGLSGSAAASLFQSTFNGCTGLTSIPENLFSGISGGVGSSAFDHTFNGCTGLTSIPENLFGNIPSTATLGSYAFRNMFNGCTNLSGPSAKINGEYIYDIWPSATTAKVGGMYTGATGLADYPCIPTNYGGESNGCIYITYNANGGSGTAPTSPTYCVIGGTCVVPENTFTRTGYNFSYWTASVDGSSLVESIAPGTDIFSGYSESDLKGWKWVELTANWSVKCNKITLNNTTNGGSGGTTVIYKKTGSTTYYSDSSCRTAITSVTVPSKANASYLGHFLTSTNSANTGTRCISSAGVLSTSTSCNVSADTTWYAHYQCADGWTDSGEYATGVCGKNITITLDNAYATTDGTDILYGRTGISYPFLDSAFTKRLTPTANPITIPVNQSVFTFNTNGGSVDLSGSTFSPSATVSGNVATFAPSTFMGYYSATSGGTQYVDRNGYITLDGILAVASATGDLIWYAQWNPSLVTITNVPRAVREGFNFSSWTVEFDNRGQLATTTARVGQRISLPASATFTANYTPITYAVTLDTQGGTGGTSGFYYQFQTPGQCMYYSSADLSACTDGASGTTLTIPTRTGYTFDGYYTAENGGGVMYVDALGTISPDLLAVPENTTLYAKWTPNCNPVYLNPTSGTAGDLWTVYKITDFPDIWFTDPMCSVRIDQAAIEALVPTRSGYTFRGFYAREDSAEFESDIVADYTTTVPYLLAYGYASPIWNVNGRTSLYASWVKDCEVPANGSCRMSIGSDGLTVDYTATCNTGYTVGNADTSTPTCTANTYTVSYAANGGSGSAPTSPTSCTYGSDCAAPANTYTRTGYTFAGWKCTGGTTACDGDIIAAGGSLKNVSTGSAITLTAQWTVNTYTVSYAANGGSGSAPTSPTSCTYGSDCTAPANTYTRTGYTFAGWKCTGGTTACDGDIIAAGGSLKNVSTGSAITLTAQWDANCNAVTLNANGGTQGSVKTLYKKTGSGTWYANSNCTTAYTTTANIVPSRSGYTFRGFYVEDLDDVSSDNSSNTRYFSTDGTAADSSKSWLITGASTLYAAWARNCTVPVGGTCSLEIKTYGYVDYTTSCSAGYTLGNADTSTPTCTAKTYTVSFNVNGGTGGQSANVTATYAAAMPAISTTAPTRAGYTFVGWYDNADYAAGVQYYTAAGASARNWNKTENATLYAGWTINGYDCKAGEYLNVTACKVCESGYYCPSTAVSYSYNGQIQGRTACSNKPENAVYTSATGNTSSSCPWTCNAGYYGTSANGNTSCAVCGTGNYCTGGLNKTACSTTYANTTTTTTTATSSSACVCAAGYGGTSASSCTACAKGYYKASAGTVACTIADKNNYVAITGATEQTACTTLGSFYTTTDSTGSDAASDCYGTTTAGKYIATANSSTQTGCTNGNYCPATTVYYGKSGMNGGGLNVCAVPYSRSAAGSDDENDCYLITSATKYVKEVGAGEEDCPAGKYCAGGSTVYKGGTVSGRNTTGGSATCPAGSYCSEGVSEPTACSTLGGGLYKDSAEGSSAPADCYVITTGGYYVANATDEAQTKCEAKYYCPAVILGYPSVGGRESCPDPASSTYKEAVSEIDWLTARCPDATTSNSSVTSSSYQTFSNTGLSAITQCPAVMTVSTPCSNFSVESARYNSTTGRYDSDKGSVYARSVKAGYYLTERYSSTYCTTNGQPNTNRMLYKKAVKCPENSYCPGGTVPVCNTGTYEESWGANACTTLGDFYTTSAEGATTNTACYGITTAGKYIATAKADETTCAAGGYCPGSVKVNYNSTGGRTPCAAGKYNASTGSSAASACVACAIGSYAVDTGNTACTACAAGTTTTATGHTSATCSACANNNDYDNSWATPSWSANKVTNLCKISNCKAGSKYSSAAGTNTTGSCTACAAGTYQATNGSTATSCSAISAGCYGGAGAITECPNVCADNKYSDAGASSCTACPTDYKNSGTTVASHAGVASCKITVSDGYYIGTAGDNSSNWDKCAAGTAKAAHTVAYGSTSSCDTCANWSYSAAGAASCTSCPALTSGWSKVDSTGTGWTTYTSCKQSQKPANCSSGGITQTATSSTQWGASSVTTALKANANYYVNGTACSACSGLASGFYPNSTAGNSGGASACYTNSLSGKYVASKNATSATNCAAGTYKGAHTVAYGSTSSCDTCGANQYSDAGAGACSACATDKGYNNSGTTATDHAGAASCKTTCMAGTMVATANAACSTPNNTAYGASWYTAEHIVAYGSTSKSLSKVSSCPTSYATVNNETATSHDAKSDCTITCAAGKVVANIDAACTTPSGSWYSAQHTVSAGGTSGTNKKSCLTNYATPSTTTQTDHDSSNDCAISCPAGTQIATANATTCTTPSGNWYVGANTVKQGSVSTVKECAVGDNLFNAESYDSLWGYISASATSVSSYANNAIVWVPVEPNTTYIISGMRGANTVTMANSAVEPAVGVTYTNFFDPGVKGKGALYRTSSDANYLILMGLRDGDGSTTATRQAILDKNVANLQIFKANSGYGIVGNTATEHDTVSDCMIYCGAGEYVAVAAGGCEDVGAGYYGAGGTVPQGRISENRGQCVAPLTTIGYGFGANEADDCGRKLHAGSEVIYLRSAPRTSPALNVKVGDDIFYGAMSTALTSKLKVKDVDNTTYSVVNDYQ